MTAPLLPSWHWDKETQTIEMWARWSLRSRAYTRADEPGTSLRASGWWAVARVRGRQWDTPSRRRAPREAVDRVRWERTL